MKNFMIFAAAACCVLFLGGCLNVDVKNPPPSRSEAAPAVDNRPTADIVRENAQLRNSLVKLEQDHKNWQTAVHNREAEKDQAKDQREAVKKDRDRWKKAAGKD